MKEITREEFKLMAAGRFVLGRGPVDSKHLEIFVDGATWAWDLLKKAQKDESLKSQGEVSEKLASH